MAKRMTVCALGATSAVILSGCSSPFDATNTSPKNITRLTTPEGLTPSISVYRQEEGESNDAVSSPLLESTPESYLSYALYHNPDIERAYQQWRAASERLPQVSSMPDPRLKVGFFLNEVETRVGPQQARVGIQQSFPWIGKLRDRKDAAAKGALAAWYIYQNAQLQVAEQLMSNLHELSYLDSTIEVTDENYKLLQSFEEVIRARYRVGVGSHPELIRVQVELGLLEDRVIQLRALRPSYVARVNAVLNRKPNVEIEAGLVLPNHFATLSAEELTEIAQDWSPVLQSIEQQVEQQRILSDVARKNGYPDLTIGIDYIVTDEAMNPTIPESGDDPILVSFGINLPIWREKYDAGVRETIARRLSISRELDAKNNSIDSQVYQAWFEHTDADRRVRLYEHSLIPKAQESLSASLAGFRTGDSEFLDLLDTERTLLEFSIAAERARADRGKGLAKLNRLVGRAIPTTIDATQDESISNQPGHPNTDEVQHP